jgi:hypothetical protein
LYLPAFSWPWGSPRSGPHGGTNNRGEIGHWVFRRVVVRAVSGGEALVARFLGAALNVRVASASLGAVSLAGAEAETDGGRGQGGHGGGYGNAQNSGYRGGAWVSAGTERGDFGGGVYSDDGHGINEFQRRQASSSSAAAAAVATEAPWSIDKLLGDGGGGGNDGQRASQRSSPTGETDLQAKQPHRRSNPAGDDYGDDGFDSALASPPPVGLLRWPSYAPPPMVSAKFGAHSGARWAASPVGLLRSPAGAPTAFATDGTYSADAAADSFVDVARAQFASAAGNMAHAALDGFVRDSIGARGPALAQTLGYLADRVGGGGVGGGGGKNDRANPDWGLGGGGGGQRFDGHGPPPPPVRNLTSSRRADPTIGARPTSQWTDEA